MKISDILLSPYQIQFTHGSYRSGVILKLSARDGRISCGEIAPLPLWSRETLEEASFQIEQKKARIYSIDWQKETCLNELEDLQLLPSALFGLESALLALLDPLPPYQVPISALFMGSFEEILQQAEERAKEGYTSAKLKIGHLPLNQAKTLILKLKDTFRLRLDVNRAWNTKESLLFFSQFPLDAFDYVEEPFQEPKDLTLFPHPLAIDESFPKNLTLEQLNTFPTLKALIYKPTIQGGMTYFCLHLQKWLEQHNISCVLSSSFESDMGLTHIASLARRLSNTLPLGLGTALYLKNFLLNEPLQINQGILYKN